jgi:adenosylcobinamide kinase/adenosylcobinamide-phosphate guanylyltransferase
MWVTNLLCTEQEVDIQAEIQAALQTMATLPGEIILVSNEVGMGIIPMGSLTRDYVDTAGHLHQDIAQIADRVVLVVAGLPMAFKGKV